MIYAQIREAYVVCMGHAKRVAVTEQLYQALEQELEEMEQSLGYRRRLLPHRHYLEHDAPHGTPSQRQREAAQSRLNRAIDNVYERQFQKALQQSSEVTEVKPHPSGEVVGVAATPEERLLRKRSLKRSSAPLQHIADERIMEEMRAGGFQAIRGKGAPIRTEPATHMLDNLDEKLNKVLINSGCVPEWISLDKEIRESVGRLKAAVRMAWLKYRSTSPPSRLAEQRWQEEREHFQLRVTNINEMIRKLNFEVPCLHMQRMPLRLDSFVERVTREVDTPPPGHGQEHVGQCETSSDSDQLWTESLSEQAVNLSDSSGSVSGEVRSQLHTLQHNTPNPSSVEESSFFGFISSLIQRFIISRQTKL